MTHHLLACSLGPVQDFIARARRTRDLWFGSFLLAEMSKAAALVLHDNGAELIFPGMPLESDQNKSKEKLKPDLSLRPGYSNVVVALLTTGSPEGVLAEARSAALQRWRKLADDARLTCQSILRDDCAWETQINDAIEFYAVWTPLPEDGGDYRPRRRRLMQLLAGRKMQRDFLPASDPDAGLPKSSLDGARETVLKLNHEVEQALNYDKPLAYRLRWRFNEQLSAVDLVKRAATQAVFPSVTRVALDTWLRGIQCQDKDKANSYIADIRTECSRLAGFSVTEDQASGNDPNSNGNYQLFPYDVQLLLKDRVDALLRQSRKKDMATGNGGPREVLSLNDDEQKALGNIKGILNRLISDFGEPNPYFAVLLADGDRIGELMDACNSKDDHKALSAALGAFADTAHRVIREKFRGACVYAGGDDVLAFLPLDMALPCCDTLRRSYADTMTIACHDLGIVMDGASPRPTLSIGLAIGHCLEPLEDLRSWAALAEAAAKNKSDLWPGGRGDALAIQYQPRGGAALMLRGRWSDDEERPDLGQRLQQWAAMLNDDLMPDRAAFQLERLALEYARADDPDQLAWDDAGAAGKAILAESLRLFTRKELDEAPRRALRAAMGEHALQPQRAALQLAQEWRLARLFAAKLNEAAGKAAATARHDAAERDEEHA